MNALSQMIKRGVGFQDIESFLVYVCIGEMIFCYFHTVTYAFAYGV